MLVAKKLFSRVTIMVDSVSQLDAVIAPGQREAIRVCLEIDASWNSKLFGHLGVHFNLCSGGELTRIYIFFE